jgi:hypothetical protein
MVEPVELRTSRPLLRRFRPGGVDDVLAYPDDVEFNRYLPHIPQKPSGLQLHGAWKPSISP